MKKVSEQKTFLIVVSLTALIIGTLLWLDQLNFEIFIRSFISFCVAPMLIILANRKHIWFRRKLRWVIRSSQSLFVSAFMFFICALVSYDGLRMVPFGFPVHIVLLGIGSIFYWSPLLIRCSFSKPTSYMHQFSYLMLTSIVFFTYHQMTFYFYHYQPTFGYLMVGISSMSVTLLFLILRWAKSESHIDRVTVKGFVVPIKEEHK